MPSPPAMNAAPVGHTACSTCRLRDLCLPIGLGQDEIGKLDSLINRRQRVRSGQHIYRANQPFHFLYAIRTGFFKSYTVGLDGLERIHGFQMGGEILGLDAINTEHHMSNAVALEDGDVCEIPFSALEDLIRAVPVLQRQFHKIMSHEIMKDQDVMKLLGSMTAEQRLAVLLVNLSARFAALGHSPTEIHLKMSREEIGNYLGLKLETVSRTFSKLQNDRLLEIDRRNLRICNLAGLKQLIDFGRCEHSGRNLG